MNVPLTLFLVLKVIHLRYNIYINTQSTLCFRRRTKDLVMLEKNVF